MCAPSSCVLGPGAGSPVGTAGKGAAARAPDVRPRPSFWGRRGGRGVLAAGREARGRPAGQGEGFRPRPRAGGWPGPAGSRARGGGRESGPRSKGKHVCGAAAEAGAGRRGRSLVPAAAPRRRRPPRARGPSPRPSLLPEGSGPGRHSLQLPPSAARISFQPSFLTFQASSFQTPGRGRGGPAAPGSAVRPRPPGEWPRRRAPLPLPWRSLLPALDLRSGPALPPLRLPSLPPSCARSVPPAPFLSR